MDDDTLWRWDILRHLQILNITPQIQDLDNKLIPINIISDGGVKIDDNSPEYGPDIQRRVLRIVV
jgi:hypothetical protein